MPESILLNMLFSPSLPKKIKLTINKYSWSALKYCKARWWVKYNRGGTTTDICIAIQVNKWDAFPDFLLKFGVQNTPKWIYSIEFGMQKNISILSWKCQENILWEDGAEFRRFSKHSSSIFHYILTRRQGLS